jgi:putative two-component system hydrogenase maturation factor HypX/HoxX
MHYKNMGLHGSEFWSYSLKKRVGKLNTRALIQGAEPVIGK